jgi:hypothetical protein
MVDHGSLGSHRLVPGHDPRDSHIQNRGEADAMLRRAPSEPMESDNDHDDEALIANPHQKYKIAGVALVIALASFTIQTVVKSKIKPNASRKLRNTFRIH